MAKASVSIRDLAAEAGVAVGTVSMALSGDPRIKASTRERIQSVAERMGYQRNIAAKSLVMRRSFLLSLIVSHSAHIRAMEMLEGVQSVTGQTDYSVIVYVHAHNLEEERRDLLLSKARQADGVIVVPVMDSEGAGNRDLLRAMHQQGTPVVQLGYIVDPALPSSVCDHRIAGRQLTQRLLDLGHRRIVLITHTAALDGSDACTDPHSRDLLKGYELTMVEAGMRPQILTLMTELLTGQNVARRQAAIADLVTRIEAEQASACVVSMATTAIELMAALQARGIAVPGQLSVVAGTDLQAATLVTPHLTVSHDPFAELGAAAARMLLAWPVPSDQTAVSLLPTLRLRDSDAPPARTKRARTT